MERLISEGVRSLARRLGTGEISSRELVDACLARIDAVNGRLGAVVALRADEARREAEAADRARSRGESSGALHGLPMTIKDSYDTRGLVSTWGTPGRAGFVPEADATVVARLRAAGAILLGKTNTPELTLSFDTTNPVYGATHNPYDLSRTPGGSSGGAAAIVAAGGSPFDVGSDTGGSVRQPSHFCGVAGLKPTSGRIPRSGHAIGPGGPLESLTQPGPLARRVEDLGLLLGILAGPDPLDPEVVPVPVGDPARVDPGGLRVALMTGNGIADPDPEIAAAVRAAATVLEKAGARVEEDVPPGIEETLAIFGGLLLYDGGAWIRAVLERAGTSVEESSLAAMLDRGPGSDRVDVGPLEVARLEEQARLFEAWERFRIRMLGFMSRYDLVLSPPCARVASDPTRRALEIGIFSYTMTWNLTGWPAAVVRAGTSPEGMPIGVQLVARPWHEEVALRAAAAVEEELGGWRPPALE
ncbi:MAG: amidase [Myxococcota bacterium]